jgi:hypothetical protein
MNRSLKANVVPMLRTLGFKGSFPHFHREMDRHVDLLCFQFSLSGGRFVVELSFSTPDRGNVYINAEIPTAQLRVSQTRQRLRLGSARVGSDHWFDFAHVNANFDQISRTVTDLLHSQAEGWWAEQRAAL